MDDDVAVGDTGPDGALVCLRIGCERRGLPTSETRCPSCGIPTDPAVENTATLERISVAALEQPRAPRETPPLVVTMNDIPGYRITAVHGDVFGLVVMSRDYLTNVGARLRTVVGGEVQGYTQMLSDSRNVARRRLWAATLARGGNAVVAFRFDCTQLGDIMSEVAAYGTAVTVERVEPAPPTSSD